MIFSTNTHQRLLIYPLSIIISSRKYKVINIGKYKDVKTKNIMFRFFSNKSSRKNSRSSHKNDINSYNAIYVVITKYETQCHT